MSANHDAHQLLEEQRRLEAEKGRLEEENRRLEEENRRFEEEIRHFDEEKDGETQRLGPYHDAHKAVKRKRLLKKQRPEDEKRRSEEEKRSLEDKNRRLEGDKRPLEGEKRPSEVKKRPSEEVKRRVEEDNQRLYGSVKKSVSKPQLPDISPISAYKDAREAVKRSRLLKKQRLEEEKRCSEERSRRLAEEIRREFDEENRRLFGSVKISVSKPQLPDSAVPAMAAMTEEQMRKYLEKTRNNLLERLDVENVGRKLAMIDPTVRNILAHSSEKSHQQKVELLLDHILKRDGALKEFFDILQKKQQTLYEEITQCVVDDSKLKSSEGRISAGTVMVMTAMTEEQMKKCLERTDVRNILLERLDVENVVPQLAKINGNLRHRLQYSLEMASADKVSKLLEHILKKDGALREFFNILEKEQSDLYEAITQCVVDVKRLNIGSSVFQVSGKCVSLDGVSIESTGCGTLVEILMAGKSLYGILAAFSVFTYPKEYKLTLVTLKSEGLGTRDFSFKAHDDQYIFACELLNCSFLLLNKDQIGYLESMKCKFLHVDCATYNGYYEKSNFAVTVRQDAKIVSFTSDLAACGCQLFFVAWISLSAGSPVLVDNSPQPAKVIALYSCGSSHSHFNSSATQCSYIVAALQHDRACLNATHYPRATCLLHENLGRSLRKIGLRCVAADDCSFQINIKSAQKIHLLAMCRGFSSQYANSTRHILWLSDVPNQTDNCLELFLETMATNLINTIRKLQKGSPPIPALYLQKNDMEFTPSDMSPKNLAYYISSLIDNLIGRNGKEIDNQRLDQLNMISACLKSHCNIKNCESWMTTDSSIWELGSTLEGQLSALVNTNANSDEPVLKLVIMLVSVVVFLHKARFAVNCILRGSDWKVEILECVELRRTHHHWFWRVKFEFHSNAHHVKVQDLIGPWSRANMEIDDDIWQEIYAILQRVSEVMKPTETVATEASCS